MGAETERHVVVLPGHVEAVWLAEPPVVGAGGPVHQKYLVTFAQLLTSKHGHGRF
jgi:hypothetical protein